MSSEEKTKVPPTPNAIPLRYARFSTLKYSSNKPDWLGAGVVKRDTSSPVVLDDEDEDYESEDSAKSVDPDEENQRQSLFRTGLPEVLRHESSTTLELFYDLWFVATLNVFTSAHEIAKIIDLASYIEFEFLLWSTWFLVVIFDVRFLSDSWIERVTRSLHLAIMIAFTEIAPDFGASEEISGVGLATSLTLLASRLVLVGQYSLTFWHLRYFLDARKQIMAVLAFNIIAACVYAGISAACASAMDTDVNHFLTLVSLAEVVLQVAITMKSELRVISFEGTHLAERLNLLTLIILGEGIIGLAKDVALVEHNSGWQPWSSSMWMIFVSGVAVIYIIFQIYFDWMHPNDMASRRQLLWTVLHAPFHFMLLLVMEGVNEFIIWWRLFEIVSETASGILDALNPISGAAPTGIQVAQRLNETAMGILDRFPPNEGTREIVDVIMARIDDIGQFSNDVFANVSRTNLTFDDFSEVPTEGLDGLNLTTFKSLLDDVGRLLTTLTHDVFSNFDLDAFEPNSLEASFKETEQELSVAFNLVFVYAFIATGLMLLLLNALHAVSKQSGWTSFNILRSVLVAAIGVGLTLAPVAITTRTLFSTIWALPSIFISLFVVLIITHAPHPTVFYANSSPPEGPQV